MEVRRIVAWLAALFGLGALLPRLIGAAFFDPHLMVAFAAMAVLFEAPVICDAVSAGAGRVLPRATLGRHIAIAAGFGFASAVLLMVIRTVASNREIDAPYFLYPDPPVIGGLLLLALGFAIFGAAAGAWITLHSYSPDVARQRLRTGFLAFLLALILAAKFGPDGWRAALTSLLTNDVILTASAVLFALLAGASALLYRSAARHRQYSA
ncbi:MAG: hypothetical protein R2762_21745 [Bryobacteraceae bacterium]